MWAFKNFFENNLPKKGLTLETSAVMRFPRRSVNSYQLQLIKLNVYKPRPNGLASRRKFWTCVQLAFRLATHLRRLALALVELKFGGK